MTWSISKKWRASRRQNRGSNFKDESYRPREKVCVVGSGWLFVSGISAYTCSISNALAEEYEVSAVLMRRLLPRRLYPGASRVGENLMKMEYRKDVKVFDGIDYFWIPSMFRALSFVRRERPDVMLFQWWSGTVLHSYLLLAVVGRLLGIRLVIEFHETQDTGEASLPLTSVYVGVLSRPLLRLAHYFVVHSEFDRENIEKIYGISRAVVVPHGPYDHLERSSAGPIRRGDEHDVFSLLFFGTIRPYKGLEYLVDAFGMLSQEEAAKFRLVVVGETWEAWDLPAQLISINPNKDQIVFENRYVHDDELAEYLGSSDAVVLPYLRSSSSGPLHLSMSHGLPVVVTDVGGLREAAGEYSGACFIAPKDADAIRQAILSLLDEPRARHEDPQSWDRSRDLLRPILSE